MTAEQFSPWRRLREIRVSKGMSQTDLADASGVSNSHISRLESGSRWPRPAVVLQLAAALNVPSYMIDRTSEESVA